MIIRFFFFSYPEVFTIKASQPFIVIRKCFHVRLHFIPLILSYSRKGTQCGRLTKKKRKELDLLCDVSARCASWHHPQRVSRGRASACAGRKQTAKLSQNCEFPCDMTNSARISCRSLYPARSVSTISYQLPREECKHLWSQEVGCGPGEKLVIWLRAWAPWLMARDRSHTSGWRVEGVRSIWDFVCRQFSEIKSHCSEVFGLGIIMDSSVAVGRLELARPLMTRGSCLPEGAQSAHLNGCVPLSHQVAGHKYGVDKVGQYTFDVIPFFIWTLFLLFEIDLILYTGDRSWLSQFLLKSIFLRVSFCICTYLKVLFV